MLRKFISWCQSLFKREPEKARFGVLYQFESTEYHNGGKKLHGYGHAIIEVKDVSTIQEFVPAMEHTLNASKSDQYPNFRSMVTSCIRI